jgi:hypothetical protein
MIRCTASGLRHVNLADQPGRHVVPAEIPAEVTTFPSHVADVLEHLDLAALAQLLDEAPVSVDSPALGKPASQQGPRCTLVTATRGARLAQPVEQRGFATRRVPVRRGRAARRAGRVRERAVGQHARPFRPHGLARGRRHDPVPGRDQRATVKTSHGPTASSFQSSKAECRSIPICPPSVVSQAAAERSAR